MKKALILVILMIMVIFTGCSDNNIIPKTEYGKDEQALLDDIYLTLDDVDYEDGILEFDFVLENKTKNTITISPDTNFRLYDINQVQVINIYNNSTNIIKKGQKINYILQYNIDKKELYDIYFYSGIVENNIKFSVTSEDID